MINEKECLVKVKKNHCKNHVRTILLNVGSKKIVISQNWWPILNPTGNYICSWFLLKNLKMGVILSGKHVKPTLGTSHNLSWMGEWRRNCFLFQIFSGPPLIAPMFFRHPPFNHVKRFKAPPFLIHNTQMVITNNVFFTLPFLLTVTSECAN